MLLLVPNWWNEIKGRQAASGLIENRIDHLIGVFDCGRGALAAIVLKLFKLKS